MEFHMVDADAIKSTRYSTEINLAVESEILYLNSISRYLIQGCKGGFGRGPKHLAAIKKRSFAEMVGEHSSRSLLTLQDNIIEGLQGVKMQYESQEKRLGATKMDGKVFSMDFDYGGEVELKPIIEKDFGMNSEVVDGMLGPVLGGGCGEGDAGDSKAVGA